MRGRPEAAERHGAGHVARCTVERLMGDLGLRGVRRAKSPRTTRSAPREQCPANLGQAPLRGVCPGWAVGRRRSPASGRCPFLCSAPSPGGSMWLS